MRSNTLPQFGTIYSEKRDISSDFATVFRRRIYVLATHKRLRQKSREQLGKALIELIKQFDCNAIEDCIENGSIHRLRPTHRRTLYSLGWDALQRAGSRERITLSLLLSCMRASYPNLPLPKWATEIDPETAQEH
jgi:hypothetical protein